MRIGLAVALWLAMAAVVAANGAVGNRLAARGMGKRGAEVYKSVVGVVVVLLASYAHARGTLGPGWAEAAWGTGVLWVCLTVGFEFLAGRYLLKNSREAVLTDCRFRRGRFWALMPVVMLAGPAAVAWAMNW